MTLMDIKSCSILVVEDTKMIRLLLLRHLQQEGYKNVLTAENGREALEILQSTPVDLVLLDIQMPVLDGYQTLEKLRADENLRDMAVIMITAVDKIESVARCIQMGAEDYMPKLFNPILLNARIESCLRRKLMGRRIKELERQIATVS
jgi:adenylate cyclase